MNILIYGLVLVVMMTPCYAYLDGGASSLLLQLVFGGVAGGLVFLKIYFRKITSFFRAKK